MDKQSHNKAHLLYIDGLRAVAALYVVMHHAMLEYKAGPKGIVQKIFLSLFKSGHYAVDLFIVISGFSLMLPAIRRNYQVTGVWEFYKRRIVRILPPYYIAMALSLLAIYFLLDEKTGSVWDECIPVTSKSIITHIFLINDLFISEVYKINHAFWSIPVECRIYIFFPFLLYLWRRFGPGASLLTAVGISVVLFITLRMLRTVDPGVDMATAGVNPYIILFTLGMLAADISFSASRLSKFADKLPWGLFLIAAAIAFVFYKSRVTFYSDVNGNIENEIVDVLFGIICFCLLVICSKEKYQHSRIAFIGKALSFKPLASMGIFAYSIYLIHAPLLHMIALYVIAPSHLSAFTATVVLILGGTSLVVGVAYLFFLLFERPFLLKKAVKAENKQRMPAHV
ncbi:acyltransferase family protein [Chitinophaga filiformis]|uniref:Peptidoglycan/LPS O-acetylase OafA/YrhL, contains acyltransferase and SGNH-hydrolase domains n=1 Tax=Chitinophaga filiformis TaxID=104663 RepID=A0A1G7PE12_CHIFI|nr:acyltransferase [Chitinophaga filiformis]SDF83720.1 Peptidoglycan/LPS O-acetylase OafA/YrhL, contains acyltransferase and SGNH-hydrolase domains [Chitinophaga filiformis]